MKTDAIWRAFAETGDPVYYLLYKSLDGKDGPTKRKKDEDPGKRDRNGGSALEG